MSVAAAAPIAPVTQLTDDLYLVSTHAGNMAVLLGKDSSMVVGPLAPSLDSAARALVAAHHAGAVRFVIAAASDSAPLYGDGAWGRDGALVLAQEILRARMQMARRGDDPQAAAASRNALPGMGFSEVVQLYVNGNSVHAIHHHPGYSSSDLIVHFENANVIYLGNTLTTDGYPAIDLSRGGSIAGMIQTVGDLEGFPATTRFIPGRGPVATKHTFDEYGAMLVAVVKRVKQLIDAGKTEAQIVASKPTATFDATWGHGPVSPDAFVGMVYESLTAKDSSQR